MPNQMKIILAAALFVTCLSPANAAAEYPDGIAGLVGLTPTEEGSCVAVWVPIGEDQALAGFSWYNNDGSTVFPEVLLESGSPDNPVTVSEAVPVAENVQGSSLGWSDVILDTPVGCQSEGLYLLLRFPAGSEYTADGQGGGSALGYRTDGEGYPGWISADGHDWAAFAGEFGFALNPVFVPADQAGLIMKGAGRIARDVQKVPLSIAAFPNPFNPNTTLRFTLPDPGKVEIAVYDVRGAMVRRLTSEQFAAGSHDVKWQGRDKHGRRVASGVYFVRMTVGRTAMTRRIVLVQ